MQIQAALLQGQGEPMLLDAVEIAPPQGDEILVRIVASGICGTDISFVDHVPLAWPAILGHEGAGIVEKTGPLVRGVAPGDHVVLTTTSCGRCDNCLQGRPNDCANFQALNLSGGRRADGSCTVHRHGKPVFAAFLGQSSFAAYSLASERSAIVVDPALPLDLLAPFGCGLQTGAGAVLNTLEARVGRSIAVFGAGAVGLSAVMAAAIAGCGPITVVDTRPERLALAEELGATRTIDAARQDAVAAIQAEGGVDYAVEATGSATVMTSAVQALGMGGKAALAGLAGGQTMALDPSLLQRRGLTVMGSVMAGRGAVPALFVRRLIRWWQEGRFPVEKLVRHYEFAQINEAIAAARDGSAVKPVLRLPPA